MSDDDNFLSRWSRLKRQAKAPSAPPADPAAPGAAPPPGLAQTQGGMPDGFVPPDEGEEELFDPATLPPVESLTADSDFTQFLRKGVPAALKTAALRKLWASDPNILNYKTFAEYDWDFNAPGYGQLLPTDNVKEAVDNLFKAADDMKRKLASDGGAPSPDPAPLPDPQGGEPRSTVAAMEDAQDDRGADKGATTLGDQGGPEPEAAPAMDPALSPLHFADAESPDPAPDVDVSPIPPPPRRRRHGGAIPG